MTLELILRTPAIVISLVGLASLPASILAGGFGFYAVVGGWLLFLITWTLALHEAAARKSGEPSGQASRWLFGVVGAVLLIQIFALPFAWKPPEPLEAFLAISGAISYFALTYLTGRKLARATNGKAGDLAFGLFLAIVYLPIGIWFLRKRVAEVAAEI